MPGNDPPRESTGQEFVRWLRPGGAILVLLLSIAVLVLCFTAGRDPIPGYKAPEDTSYYAQHLDVLQQELETSVFPNVEGIVDCYPENGRLTVVIESSHYAVTRSALLYYFDESLFTFQRS